MVSTSRNRKKVAAFVGTFAAATAVAVPVGVVYGTKSSSSATTSSIVDPSGESTAQYTFGSVELPKVNEKKVRVTGYLDWTVAYHIGTKEVTDVEELNKLDINDTFVATYTALKDPKFSATKNAVYKVNYLVVKGNPTDNPSGSVANKVYLNNSLTLPSDKFSCEQIPGWLGWSAKFTSGETEYKTVSQLNSITPGQKFMATYTAAKDPKYNTITDAVYTVEYTVKTPTSSLISTTHKENYVYGSEVPTENAPSNAQETGYLPWEPVVYQQNTKVLTAAEVKALEIDQTFTATYRAKPDVKYNTTEDLTITTTYTVVKINESTITDQTDNYSENYTYATTAPEMHKPSNDSLEVGYIKWTDVKYYQGVAEITASQIKALDIGAKFTAVYTAQKDPHYTIGKKVINVTYTVIKANGTSTTDTLTTHEADYTYGSEAPELYKPLDSSLTLGLTSWAAVKYFQGTTELTVEQVKKVEPSETFKAVYTAIKDSHYNVGSKTIEVTYTVKKINGYPSVDTVISSSKENYTYGSTPVELHKPTAEMLGAAFTSWAPVKYFKGTTELTIEEVKKVEINETFKAVYTAIKNPHYNVANKFVEVEYTVQKINKGNMPIMARFDAVPWIIGSEVPTIVNPGQQYISAGYLRWTNGRYRITWDSDATLEEIKALPVGSTFAIVFDAEKDPHYIIGDYQWSKAYTVVAK